ncbi:MAG: flippase-like domain-containing protein [bacterium]|nr:flippase-like domain-containing protein [bacterium]
MTEERGKHRVFLSLFDNGAQNRKKSLISFLLRLIGAALCLGIVFYFADFEHIYQSIGSCKLKDLLLSSVFFTIGALAGGLAWMVILKAMDRKLSFWSAMHLTLTGFVLNNLIPGGIAGDIYRAYGTSQKGIPAEVCAASVILERWASLVSLLVSTAIADILTWRLLHLYYIDHDWAPQFIPITLFRLDIIMLMALALLFAAIVIITYAAVTALRYSAKASLKEEVGRFGADWGLFKTTLEKFSHQKKAFFIAVIIDLISPFAEAMSFAYATSAVGISFSPYLFLAFFPLFRIISHLPISINAIGPQELLVMILWKPLGAEVPDSAAASLIIHGLKILLSFIGLPLLALPIYPDKTDT